MQETDKTVENDEQLEDINNEDNDTSTEGEGKEESEGEESDTVTLTKAELAERERAIRKEQDKRWKQRLKDAEDGEEGTETGDKATSRQTTEDDKYDRLYLKTENITLKKEQDRVIELARALKLDIADAVNAPAVKAELKAMRDKSSTPPSSTRTGAGRQDDVAYWATQLTKNGKSAPTAELRAKVRAYLAGK